MYYYVRGMLSHGIMPRRVMVQQSRKVKFLRTHSSNSMENSFSASITMSMRFGSSIDPPPDESSKITSCANLLLLIGKQLAIYMYVVCDMIGNRKGFDDWVWTSYIAATIQIKEWLGNCYNPTFIYTSNVT